MVQISVEEAKLLWNARPHGQSTFDAVFCEGSPYKNIVTIKKFLVETLLPNKCFSCSITEWLGEPIELHLDHINGDPRNHSITNLRLLCPNCHSQTGTYCKGNSLNKGTRKGLSPIPKEDFIKALSTSHNIRQALMSLGLQAHGANYTRAYELATEAGIEIDNTPILLKRPVKEELLHSMIQYQCTAKLAQIYGASRSTIREWLKLYKIPYSRNDMAIQALNDGGGVSLGLPTKEVILGSIKDAGCVSLGAIRLGITVKKLRKVLKSIPKEWELVKQELSIRAHTRKVVRPPKAELQELLDKKIPFTALGNKFGVSDNAVRKWAKAYGIKY